MTGTMQRAAYASYREFYEQTYGHAMVECRSLHSAGAHTIHCLQGAGDWSDAATPDIVVGGIRNICSAGTVNLGAGSFRMAPLKNRGIVVPPGVASTINMDGPHDVLLLAVPFRQLQELVPGVLPADGDFGPVHAQELSDPYLHSLVDWLWVEADACNPHGRLFTEAALVTLAASLMRLSGAQAIAIQARGGLAPWQIRRATEALSDQLGEDISLGDLAGEVGLSPFHFSRAFKQSLGVPPHRYRTRLRLEKACELLETTNAPVTEIAFSVGYDSSQALARIFARDLGVTPTQWRRERRR